MPIMFNSILKQAGLTPTDVILLRHQDQRAARGRTPYELWRDDTAAFNLYQSHQATDGGPKFRSAYWASFVGTPAGETLFVGLYDAHYRGLLDQDTPMPSRDGIDKAGTCDVYDLTLHDDLTDLIGKLYIDWGPGTRAWVQRADRQNKPVTELRTAFKEPAFPGFLNFSAQLSTLDRLPPSWKTILKGSKGVYILTCPDTKEQYVGSATGHDGFWQRWQDYAITGHGGNVALKSRKPCDYRVAILQAPAQTPTTTTLSPWKSAGRENCKAKKWDSTGDANRYTRDDAGDYDGRDVDCGSHRASLKGPGWSRS